MPERELVVHNTVRRVTTRSLRTRSPGRHRFTQRINGGAIVVKRKCPRTYPESVIMANLEALKEANAVGALEVRTKGGELVDLSTMTAAPQEAPASPPPNFKQDSAKDDVNPQRPPRASENVNTPTPEAQGALPELLKPTLEETAERSDTDPAPAPDVLEASESQHGPTDGQETPPTEVKGEDNPEVEDDTDLVEDLEYEEDDEPTEEAMWKCGPTIKRDN